MKKIELTAPSFWASYLINGDASNMDDCPEEKEAAESWVASVGAGAPVSCADAGFMWRHDAYDFMPVGADCQTYTFLTAKE